MTSQILRQPVTRRDVIKTLAFSATAFGASRQGVAARSLGRASQASELNVAGWTDQDGSMKALLERYTQETGIKTNYLEMPAKWSDLVTKYTSYLQSGYDGIDVYLLDDFVVAQFSAAGWILDMKSAMTQPEIDAWLPAVQEMFSFTGGIYRLPVFFGCGAMYYRKDILETEGLAPPKTWDELITTGTALKSKYPDVWPWAPMSDTNNQDVNYTIQSIWQGGGDPKVMNDEGTIRALQHMRDLIEEHQITPQAITTYGTDQTRPLAKEGKQIMWWDFEDGLAEYDADDSPIKGKVGVALWPAGPGGDWGMAHSWGWGVSKFSPDPEAAIAFAKWATDSPQLKEFMVNIAGRTPPKTDLANDPEVQATVPFTTFLAEAASHLRYRIIDIPNPLEVHDVIGKTGSSVLTGQRSVEDAAEWGHEQMQRVLQPAS